MVEKEKPSLFSIHEKSLDDSLAQRIHLKFRNFTEILFGQMSFVIHVKFLETNPKSSQLSFVDCQRKITNGSFFRNNKIRSSS
jgi:hypothetical protein